MRIVHQAAPDSHSHFSPPLLMLSAPCIAGLLPARLSVDKPFEYTHPGLADLPTERRTQLLEAVTTLLDVALDFNLHGLGEDALRAAEVLFHRAAGGTAPKRYTSPAAYRAEHEADTLDIMVGMSRRLAMVREQAERDLAEGLRAYQEGHHA